jgi:NitT/TauT family transport system permease protein
MLTSSNKIVQHLKWPALRQKFLVASSLTAGLIFWELIVWVLKIRPVILPKPTAIFDSLYTNHSIIVYHSIMTTQEIALGYLLGVLFAIVLAIIFQLAPKFRLFAEPYLVVSQLIPKVALAPLFIIWLGFSIQSKVIIAALVCFFPTFINTYQGLSAYDQDLAFMMRCLRASPLVTLKRLQIPFAVPYIMAGLKSSALLSVTGCIIAEFIGADRGLGFLLLQAEAQLDTPLLFAALLALALIGIFFYLLPIIMETTLFKKYMPKTLITGGITLKNEY